MDTRIHVVPHPDGWATRFTGAPISQTFVSRREALAWADDFSQAHGAEVVLHDSSSMPRPGSLLRLHFA